MNVRLIQKIQKSGIFNVLSIGCGQEEIIVFFLQGSAACEFDDYLVTPCIGLIRDKVMAERCEESDDIRVIRAKGTTENSCDRRVQNLT